MPIEPEHPTEKYIQGRISFHTSQAEYFEQNNQKPMAAWARSMAETWKQKLQLLFPKSPEQA